MVMMASKPCQPSGLTALANLIQKKLPGDTRSEAFEMIKESQEGKWRQTFLSENEKVC